MPTAKGDKSVRRASHAGHGKARRHRPLLFQCLMLLISATVLPCDISISILRQSSGSLQAQNARPCAALSKSRQNRLCARFANYAGPRMGRRPKARRNAYGAWLHHLRKEAELTQEDAAKLAGISRTTLTTWERIGDLPGRREIFRLARAYQVSIQRLLRTEKLDQN